MTATPRPPLPVATQGLTNRAQIHAMIKRDGFACSGIIPGRDGSVGWTYTIGLTLAGHPELVVPDIPGRVAVNTIHDVAAAIARRQRRLHPGEQLDIGGQPWTVKTSFPRASVYGVPLALAVYGERRTVRAYTLLPPPHLTWPPGTPWHGYDCTCCQGGPGRPGIADSSSRIGSITVVTPSPGYSGLLPPAP